MSQNNNSFSINIEGEVKFIDIDANKVINKLLEIGAKKVFEGERTFVILDTPDLFHFKNGNELRFTIEGSQKLSYETIFKDGTKKSDKLKLANGTTSDHIAKFFKNFGISPVFEINSRRVSFEYKEIDFDIDWFPYLNPFIEVDVEESELKLDSVIQLLDIEKYQMVQFGTRQVYESKGMRYEELFRISSNI